jgi:hypothetical protein
VRLAAFVAAAAAAAGCTDFATRGESPTQLLVRNIQTARGAGTVPTAFTAGPLLSDVQDANGTVFDDFASVTLRAQLKDLGAIGVASTPTVMNDITVSRYRVSFRRSDGRNVEGVDVPRSFEGALTATIVPNGELAVVVELVRHVAKLEAPLAALRNNLDVISADAEITFFGRDQAGNAVSASGSVLVNFANFN